MVKDESTLTNEIVKKQYEELMTNGLPFLQIFPEMIQESNVAETFKTRANEQYKGLTQDNINYRNAITLEAERPPSKLLRNVIFQHARHMLEKNRR